jgi:HAD superfamily hydrolase (TIGR01484 family)
MDGSNDQEKLIVISIALIGLCIALAGFAIRAILHDEYLVRVIEMVGLFVGGIGIGGLPVRMILDGLSRRKQRKAGEEIRRLYQKMVISDRANRKENLPKLFAMDIEGCITPSGRSTIDLIRLQRLRAYCDYATNDHRFPPIIFYTGRSQGYVELLAQELGIVNDPRDLPSVIESGTALYYPNSKKTVLLGTSEQLLKYRRLINEVAEILHEELPKNEFEPKCYMITINPEPNQNVEDLLTKVDRILRQNKYETDLSASTVIGEDVKGRFRVTSSASAVDITPENHTKLSALWEAVKEAAKKNILQQELEGTVAIGDHSNDVEVLRVAGKAYCPEDAHGDVLRLVRSRDENNVISQKDIDFVITVIERECGLRIVDPLAS